MPVNSISQTAIQRLGGILATLKDDGELRGLIAGKDEVLGRFQPVFAPGNIPSLAEEDFKSVLLFENNRHWTGLHRRSPLAHADMDLIRRALAILVDESKPIGERLNLLIPKNSTPMVRNLGRAVITAILHLVYPDKYSVWNGTSEAAMRTLGLWPKFDRGASFGERYVTVNDVLLAVAKELETDLWTVDFLWWRVRKPAVMIDITMEGTGPIDSESGFQFGLEKYLHEFLRDNWGKTPLGSEWALHEEDGDLVGYKYNTGEVGEIDLLAKHKEEPRWLVVELKRDQSSDDTIGQALRYMGWVEDKLATGQDLVEGIIIAHSSDAGLEYALKRVKGVKLMMYSVEFHLRNA